MYPNYQTDAGPGGKVTYTPTDKTIDTTKRKEAFELAKEQGQSLGLTGKELADYVNNAMKRSQFGGESFEYGGYVYTVYPNY
jgi:hypothetical protein